MIRALKVVLSVFGVVEILFGLLLVILPDQAASISGFSDISGYTKYAMMSLGMSLVAASVFLIIAARDPLLHIKWVKFAILWCALGVVGGLYSVILGDVQFDQAGMQIIMDAVFAVVFLALYPYKAVRAS